MHPITTAKIVIFAVGIIVWLYGVLSVSRTVQFVGLGIVAVAAIMRFAGPRTPQDRSSPEPPAG
jgi:hypothetical protein